LRLTTGLPFCQPTTAHPSSVRAHEGGVECNAAHFILRLAQVFVRLRTKALMCAASPLQPALLYVVALERLRLRSCVFHRVDLAHTLCPSRASFRLHSASCQRSQWAQPPPSTTPRTRAWTFKCMTRMAHTRANNATCLLKPLKMMRVATMHLTRTFQHVHLRFN
jgi:hypothetical protein